LVLNTQWQCLAVKYERTAMDEKRKAELNKCLGEITSKKNQYKHALLTSMFGIGMSISANTVSINEKVAQGNYVMTEPFIIAAKEVLRFDSLNKYLDKEAFNTVQTKLAEVRKLHPQFF